MKTFTLFIIALFSGVTVLAQAPQSFRYQAVARDNSGIILANELVSFRISILSGSVSGTAAYSETHSGLSTNTFGLVELEIGKGTPETGTFSSIDWGSDSYFVKIEMDPAGGIAYQVLITSQLLSVPYAFQAKTASQLKYKTIPLNIYGAYLPDNVATFEDDLGIYSCILFRKINTVASFNMNFTLPQDYVTGDPIKIRMLVSAFYSGVVDFQPNTISVLRAGSGNIVGYTASMGLTIDAINITKSNIVQEVFGYITSPVASNPLQPEDVISFSFFRAIGDANPGIFRIHGIEIRY